MGGLPAGTAHRLNESVDLVDNSFDNDRAVAGLVLVENLGESALAFTVIDPSGTVVTVNSSHVVGNV